MTDKKPNKIMVPQGGMLRDFVLRLKLITRLMVRPPREFLSETPAARFAGLSDLARLISFRASFCLSSACWMTPPSCGSA
jgi:hypothetical protein